MAGCCHPAYRTGLDVRQAEFTKYRRDNSLSRHPSCRFRHRKSSSRKVVCAPRSSDPHREDWRDCPGDNRVHAVIGCVAEIAVRVFSALVVALSRCAHSRTKGFNFHVPRSDFRNRKNDAERIKNVADRRPSFPSRHGKLLVIERVSLRRSRAGPGGVLSRPRRGAFRRHRGAVDHDQRYGPALAAALGRLLHATMKV